ncbi:MAG: hypothetical protein RL885_23485 [Planctomycetota bacterium]
MRGRGKLGLAIVMLGLAIPLWWRQLQAGLTPSAPVVVGEDELDIEAPNEPIGMWPASESSAPGWPLADWQSSIGKNPFLSPSEEAAPRETTTWPAGQEASPSMASDPETPADRTEAPRPPIFTVNAVVITNHGRRALLGRDIVHVGDTYDGGVIEGIETWGIVFVREGTEWKLELAPRARRGSGR